LFFQRSITSNSNKDVIESEAFIEFIGFIAFIEFVGFIEFIEFIEFIALTTSMSHSALCGWVVESFGISIAESMELALQGSLSFSLIGLLFSYFRSFVFS